ncbi:hypothetical protein E2542_SST17628 [Spatholobus suberectus]|nr:hypothetical protein E2542_SST17628 [Spatholobus suberectus]
MPVVVAVVAAMMVVTMLVVVVVVVVVVTVATEIAAAVVVAMTVVMTTAVVVVVVVARKAIVKYNNEKGKGNPQSTAPSIFLSTTVERHPHPPFSAAGAFPVLVALPVLFFDVLAHASISCHEIFSMTGVAPPTFDEFCVFVSDSGIALRFAVVLVLFLLFSTRSYRTE